MDYRLDYSGPPSATVNFSLKGEHLQPEVITKALGVTPDDAWVKGDQRINRRTGQPNAGAPLHTFGHWRLTSPSSSRDEFEDQLDRLLSRLEDLPPTLHTFIQEFDGTIVVGYSSSEVSIGIYLSLGAIQQMAHLGVAIVFDIYPVTPDTDDDETVC